MQTLLSLKVSPSFSTNLQTDLTARIIIIRVVALCMATVVVGPWLLEWKLSTHSMLCPDLFSDVKAEAMGLEQLHEGFASHWTNSWNKVWPG